MFPALLAAAEASPTPESLKAWLEVFLYLCGIVAAAAVAWAHITNRASRTEISEQPLEIKAHAGTVSRDELKQVHGRIERERREIDQAISTVAAAAEKRAEKLEGKVDDNTNMTREMKGEVTQINQNVQTLTSSLTNFLQHQARRE
jgi:seryl-tRNA synthetase